MLDRKKLHYYASLPRTAPTGPWMLPALCTAYGLPRNLTGGNTIGIIELGGAAHTSDMLLFCNSVGMPIPNMVAVGTPFVPDPGGADVEVALDQQVAAFVNWWCTGKIPTIRTYWVNDMATGIAMAAHDGCDVCSISWGAPEDAWGKPSLALVNQAAMGANAMGTAVFAASGDSDAGDGESGVHVDGPASCPAIVGCSGTTKTATSETVWNNSTSEGTGGGYSSFWPMPTWQKGVPKMATGRMVGDLAFNADPNTGYQIVANGRHIVVGGTSASAPCASALAAAVKAKPGKVSHRFYNHPELFNKVMVGTNGRWPGTVCCGLGVPIGAKVAGLFS
jgi:kumamolisin